METAVQKGTLLWNSINSALIVSSLVRKFVPEKSRKSIMLRQTEAPFEVLLNWYSYIP